MLNKNHINLLLILITLFFASCKHSLVEIAPVEIAPFVCFESEVLPIFITNCSQAGCHGNGSHEDGYTLDNYNGIMKGIEPFNPDNSEHLSEITSGEMPLPPNSPLTSEQIETLRNWINGGAENSTGCDTSSVCDTTAVTYSNQVSEIMTKFCVGCHSGSPPQGGIDLTNYTNVKNQITLGRFWGSVNLDAGFSAMPLNSNQLNSCDLATLKIWIDNGSPNN